MNNELVKKQTRFMLTKLPASKIPKNTNLDDEYVLKGLLPDIIFHDLDGPEHNFLVFEVKKSTNKDADDRIMDSLKLSAATAADLIYEYGVFVDFT